MIYIFWLSFSSFSSVCAPLIELLLGLLSSSKIPEKASSRLAILTMEEPSVVKRKFAPNFSLKFLSIFMHISDSIDPITLVRVSLKRAFPHAELGYRWCQFLSRLMTSEVDWRPTLITASYSWHRCQWVRLQPMILWKSHVMVSCKEP